MLTMLNTLADSLLQEINIKIKSHKQHRHNNTASQLSLSWLSARAHWPCLTEWEDIMLTTLNTLLPLLPPQQLATRSLSPPTRRLPTPGTPCLMLATEPLTTTLATMGLARVMMWLPRKDTKWLRPRTGCP